MNCLNNPATYHPTHFNPYISFLNYDKNTVHLFLIIPIIKYELIMCHSEAYINVKHKDKQHLHILYNK